MGLTRALCVAIGMLLSAGCLAQPVALQGVRLVNQRAQPVVAELLRGRFVLLHFVFTGCSTTCPTQVRELAALHQSLPAAVRGKVSFVSVSLDPNDTPATLAAFARRLGAEHSDWQFASGSAADIDRLAARMQAFDPAKTRPGLEDHRTSLYLYDARGALVQRYAGVPVDRPRLRRELTQLATPPSIPSDKSQP